MLGQRRRRWANIGMTLGQLLVLAGILCTSQYYIIITYVLHEHLYVHLTLLTHT